MLDGGGYFRGTSVMVSGAAGTGKTSLAVLFAAASGKRRERTLYFAMEESALQIQRNMASIGIDLAELRRKKLLDLRAARPTVYGLEMHLVAMNNAIEELPAGGEARSAEPAVPATGRRVLIVDDNC